jgi:RNA polymerase sigma factor (sigma-70 family)
MLVRRARRGDRGAQEALFGRYRSRLYRLALRLLHRKEDAEDAVQDALLSAYRNLGSFEGRSLFSTWLTRIVFNAALGRMRRQRARPEMFLQDLSNDEHVCSELTFVDWRPDPEQACAAAETHDLVSDALQQLSPSIRFAFRLRGLQELSNAEGAQVAGIEVEAFKSRISRARSQLAERFSPAAIAPLQKAFTTPVIPLRRVLEEDSAASSAG